jgi:hypothetical protein
MKIISFSTELDILPEYKPIPASKLIPDWYKSAESYLLGKKIPGGQANTTATIKKCMPVFDAIIAGYIIVSPADVFVSKTEEGSYFEWSAYNLIEFHPNEQAKNHPLSNASTYPKWQNPWAIKTAKGYSCLFVQPLHRESLFTILPGIVDTDTYNATVNFPFVLNDANFEGLIPAGTPLAQVIPIKREQWQMQFDNFNQEETRLKMHTKIFDRYKSMFWSKKEYK